MRAKLKELNQDSLVDNMLHEVEKSCNSTLTSSKLPKRDQFREIDKFLLQLKIHMDSVEDFSKASIVNGAAFTFSKERD